VLLIQGDTRKPERDFIPEPDGHVYASDLIQQVVDLNNGIYLDDELQNAMPSDFCIGVAGYPEKHYASPNMQNDLKYLKLKQDKGADYIVTQMFFDNQSFFDFVKRCREAGITLPIIPGLKPLTSAKQLTILPQIFYVDLPMELTKEVEKCKTNEEVLQVGIEWTIQQSKELMEFGIPSLHYYSMGKSDSVYEVAKALF
jgi:methylenetetrahydrofolate reductase (NADPH)